MPGKMGKMKIYRGAIIEQEVVAEYTNNFYAGCKTCLKLIDGKFYKAIMIIQGYDHFWNLTLLPIINHKILYENY